MKSVKVILVLTTITLLTFACNNANNETTNRTTAVNPPTTSAPTATPDEMASARIQFLKNCVTCHGEKGEGGLKEVDGKRFKVPNLREGHALKHTDEKFVLQITEGDDEMPAFKDKLTPEEIQGLVRLIRKEFQGK